MRAAFAPDSPIDSAPRLWLGSRSPRRADLLRRAGFVFRAFDPPYQDPADPNTAVAAGDGVQRARGLAERKAASVAPADLPAGVVLLTADTLVVAPGGGLLGTPETAEQAAAMLRELRGATHVVATGVCLRGPGAAQSFVATARVTLGEIGPAEIEAYVAGGAWRGKAGGYNLQERVDDGWPVDVVGEPAAVMGLPLEPLIPRLEAWGIRPAGRGGRLGEV